MDAVGVPPECRLVFDEAKKDRCFGRAALARIRNQGVAWLSLLPRKLERTFDDVGAPGWYLNTSNRVVFGARHKMGLGILEVLAHRIVLLALALAVARHEGPHRYARWVLGAGSALLVCFPTAWLAVGLLVLAACLLGRRLFDSPALLMATVGLCATAVIHGVFFGGARYLVVVWPWVIAAAALALPKPRSEPGSSVATAPPPFGLVGGPQGK